MAVDRPSRGRTATHPDPSTSFAALGVPEDLCQVLRRDGIAEPFPIQASTLPDVLDGRDVLGRGRTGSGKTLAFALPVVVRASASATKGQRAPRALILAPTRELVRQIDETIRPLAQRRDLRTVTLFGGVPHKPQINALRRGVDIVVACPGRLEDLQRAGHLRLDAVEITVLDEADHMADLGFLPSVTRILASTPKRAQRLLFSATLDRAVDGLVRRFLTDPVVHHVDDETSPVDAMDHHVLHVSRADRLAVLVDLASGPDRSLVFTRTKHRAKQLTRQLVAAGVPAVELHGNLSQGARTRNLVAFRDGTATTLVATDIAARGIHVDDVNLVVHADPPVEHKSYLHRSGRTARAGAAGTVVTLATEDQHRDVQTLGRKAGVAPTVTTLGPGHPLLRQLAPGRRVDADLAAFEAATRPSAPAPARRRGSPARQRSSGPSKSSTSRHGSSRGSSSKGSARSGSSSRNGTASSRQGSAGGRPGSKASSRPADRRHPRPASGRRRSSRPS